MDRTTSTKDASQNRASNTEGICHRCARWNFSKLFIGSSLDAKIEGPPKRAQDIDSYDRLGDLWEVRPLAKVLSATSKCSICNLVIHILRKHGVSGLDGSNLGDNSTVTDKVIYRKHDISLWAIALKIQLTSQDHNIHHRRLEPTLQREKKTWLILPAEGAKLPENSEKALAQYACRQISPYCDYKLVDSWLDTCQSSLLHKCSGKNRFGTVTINQLRFIDIANSCIKVMAFPQKFAALSYVWGTGSVRQMTLTKTNFETLTKPQAFGELWHEVPTTIKDAIEVCRNCHIPYLWVDALCVIQDGPDLQNELGQMTEIYSSAYVTLIAAYGHDSWSGLKGVSSARKIKQAKARFGQMSLLEGLPLFSSELHESNWPHRAWTLQEHLFSTRCLIFLENRIIFQCQTEWLDESMISPGHSSLHPVRLPATAPRLRLYDDFDLNQDERADMIASLILGWGSTPKDTKARNFLNFVETYFRLDLTYDSDIINACQGTLNSFKVNNNMEFFWAMPMFDFVFSLTFLVENCVRREGMPSWSWVGWRKDGTVKSEGSIEFYLKNTKQLDIRSTTQFYKLAPPASDTGRPSLQVLDQDASQRSWTDRAAHELFIRSSKVKLMRASELEQALIFSAPVQQLRLDKDEGLFSVNNYRVALREVEMCKANPDDTINIEFVEIGSLWKQKLVRGFHELTLDSALCLMVKTDARGISERIGVQTYRLNKRKNIDGRKRWVVLT